jgi:calmodulin
MRSLGQDATESEVQDILNEVDADSSGSISFDEFVTMMVHKIAPADSDTELREAFRVFDRDGSGTISAEELKEVMLRIGENLSADEIKAMIEQADSDGDGKIDCKWLPSARASIVVIVTTMSNICVDNEFLSLMSS